MYVSPQNENTRPISVRDSSTSSCFVFVFVGNAKHRKKSKSISNGQWLCSRSKPLGRHTVSVTDTDVVNHGSTRTSRQSNPKHLVRYRSTFLKLKKHVPRADKTGIFSPGTRLATTDRRQLRMRLFLFFWFAWNPGKNIARARTTRVTLSSETKSSSGDWHLER